MNKRIVLLLLIPLLLIGCTKKIEKFYLDSEYYNEGKFIEVDSLDNLDNKNYILYTYNNYCSLPIPCVNIFEEFMKNNNIDVISIPFEEFKNTKFYKEVKYAPSIIIVNNGKIVDYLDANSDQDIDKYQNIEEFTTWISKYIYLTK